MFRFTNWWLLATGAILLAVVGFATVLSLHILKGPTPSEVRMFYHLIVNVLTYSLFVGIGKPARRMRRSYRGEGSCLAKKSGARLRRAAILS